MKNTIEESEEYKKFAEEFDQNINFLNSFCELLFYNGRRISIFADDQKIYTINTTLIDSSIQTLKSIKLCCSIGSFTDANTLIRKLRDDLILYVFILDVVTKRKTFIEEDINDLKTDNVNNFFESFSKLRFNDVFNENEKAVVAWLNSTVLDQSNKIKRKLSFENYMTHLKQNDTITKILQNYNLEDYWETLRKRLNNYVHNNGIQFTSHNMINGYNPQLEVYFKNANVTASYVITFFLILIVLTESPLISSSDMIDYLVSNEKPPEDCQYEIAPFIQKYIDEKVVKMHPELKQYLINNNSHGMKIN
jgi:hypothetical protein